MKKGLFVLWVLLALVPSAVLAAEGVTDSKAQTTVAASKELGEKHKKTVKKNAPSIKSKRVSKPSDGSKEKSK